MQTAELAACISAAAGGGWANRGFVAQRGRVVFEVTATPSAPAIDAVVGVSDGPASQFAQLAAIVRFAPSGTIDVRDGSAYAAEVSFPYAAGTAYRLQIILDLAEHTYAVAVQAASGEWTYLARGYRFRTEQAQVTELDNLATAVDSSAGALEICDLQITPMTNAGCPIAEAGLGFVDESFPQAVDRVGMWDVEATPSGVIDGVIGVSRDAPESFADLAAAVRFAPSGLIDARNGGAYQADVAVPYDPTTRRIRIVADVSTQTYSAYVSTGPVDSVQLARRYAFRSPVSSLAALGMIIDSPTGTLAVCNVGRGVSTGVRFLREGNYAVAPLDNGELLISDGSTTLRLDSGGHTLAQLARGGQLAVDPAGGVYLARIAGTAVVVEAYTAGLAPRWSRTFPAGSGHRVLAIGADLASVVVAAGPDGGGVDLIKRWLANGTESTTRTGPMADAVAIGPAGFVLGSAQNGTVVVTRWPLGPAATPTWQRVWQNQAQIRAMAIAPDGGVVFTGPFFAPINFGGPTIDQNHFPDFADTYAVALTPAGEHQFSVNLAAREVFSVASRDGITAISTTDLAQVFDAQGHRVGPSRLENPLRGSGTPVAIAVAGGLVYWNFAMTWPTTGSPQYPYLIVYRPDA